MAMTPNERKAALVLIGVRQSSIAEDLNVTTQAVNRTIGGKIRSARIERAVAKRIGRPTEEVFDNQQAA